MKYTDKQTGEIHHEANRFQMELDKATVQSTNMHLTDDAIIRLRPVTGTMTLAQIAGGITCGVVFGKTIFTGVCISIASLVIIEMMTPTDFIYKKALRS